MNFAVAMKWLKGLMGCDDSTAKATLLRVRKGKPLVVDHLEYPATEHDLTLYYRSDRKYVPMPN